MRRATLPALLLAVAPLAAGADEYHYNDVFMGARATGLAGTMIGLADDPSAAYYNPAGLAHASHEVVSLSGTAILAKELTLKGFLGEGLDLASTAAFSPASVATSPLFSGRFAFSGLSPSSDAYRVNLRLDSPPPDSGLRALRLTRELSDDTYLVGFSYGQEASPDFDVGIGAFYVYRSYREQRTDFRHFSSPQPDGSVAFQRVHDEVGISHGAMLVLGLLYHPGGEKGRFRLGVSARTGANVSTAAHLEQDLFVGFPDPADASGVRYEHRLGESRQDAVSKIPPAVGIGFSYRILPRWTVAADGTLHGFSEYEDLGRTVTKLATGNASVATEVEIVPEFVVRAGLFTNRTSAPSELSTTDVQPDAWDQFGGTLGFTVRDDDNHTYSLAAKAALMSGRGGLPTTSSGVSLHDISGFEAGVVFGGSYFL